MSIWKRNRKNTILDETYTLGALKELLDDGASICDAVLVSIINASFKDKIDPIIKEDGSWLVLRNSSYHGILPTRPINYVFHSGSLIGTIDNNIYSEDLTYKFCLKRGSIQSFRFENMRWENNLPNEESRRHGDVYAEFYNIIKTIEDISLIEDGKLIKTSFNISYKPYYNTAIQDMIWDMEKKELFPRKGAWHYLDFTDDLGLLKSSDAYSLTLAKGQLYVQLLKNFVLKYAPIYLSNKTSREEDVNERAAVENKFLYSVHREKMNPLFYQGDLLKYYDLSKVNFSGKDLSHLDFSKNKEANINFSDIIPTLEGSSFEGFALQKHVFHNFNLRDANLKNTSAGVDLASCSISFPSKLNSGTLFDEKNTFYFGNKKLTNSEVENLGIKIYRKEK